MSCTHHAALVSAHAHMRRMCEHLSDLPPCCLQASVENYRNYRHVTWYTLFILLYMLVLYFQVRHASTDDLVDTCSLVSCKQLQ
jgi:hypothetical protein